jgi:hypothetical protein
MEQHDASGCSLVSMSFSLAAQYVKLLLLLLVAVTALATGGPLWDGSTCS